LEKRCAPYHRLYVDVPAPPDLSIGRGQSFIQSTLMLFLKRLFSWIPFLSAKRLRVKRMLQLEPVTFFFNKTARIK
jgi:hypothetical protein